MTAFTNNYKFAVALTLPAMEEYSATRTVAMWLRNINEWVKQWGGLLSLFFGAGILLAAFQFAANYGAVRELVRSQAENVGKIPSIERDVATARPYIGQLPGIAEQTSKIPTMDKRLFAVSRSLDRDVIPNLNILLDKANLPKVQPAKIEEIAELLEKDRAKWQPALSETAKHTNAAVSELAENFWTIGDQVLQPEVEKIAVDAVKPLVLAWNEEKERRLERAKSAPRPPGQSFDPGSVLSPPRPEVRASIKDGVIFISGIVSSAQAKAEIEQAFQELRPKHIENKLEVKPW